MTRDQAGIDDSPAAGGVRREPVRDERATASAGRWVESTVDDVAGAVRDALRSRDATAALAILNARTRFRFTGVYRTEPPMLRNLALHDRENPTLNVSGACSRLDHTFCVMVRDRNAPFSIEDAGGDSRLQPLTSNGAVLSYAGVPLRSPGGQVVGTLCHFDGRPRLLPPGELGVLEAVAPIFATWLLAPDGER